ncbi:putative hydrolase or acyltransferase of alpha/beta superfamily [Pseudomonas sp. GM21]|uniref:alpha/beta fold hydrolase n=1 Tax=Pseudomonas sp. GM21 TaxID=1144325 RepID=UPI0002722F2B|nr:alpha/beta hydrolase [Pseudomonas sp. GM21]EJM21090.1 putative hydrolase or acyltransferase of alpha/beta superfamily [Pseudomonas sp. GM21]
MIETLSSTGMCSEDTRDYCAKRVSRSEYIEVRGSRLHLRRWGSPHAPLLVLLHGWMDNSATWQFLVDQLQQDWNIIAPDWAGFGLSERRAHYAFTEYLADLEAFLDQVSPDEPVRLVAHSMGANICNVYAGVRPTRIRSFINLEGFGTFPNHLATLGTRIGSWLDSLARPGEGRTVHLPDVASLARRMLRKNPRIDQAQADFLARHFVEPDPAGGMRIAADVKTFSFIPIFPHPEQFETLLSQITARVLFVRGADSFVTQAFKEHEATLQRRFDCVTDSRAVLLDAAGHNLQHDAPHELAALIDEFLEQDP